jgi:hypothetical protein
MKCCEYGPWYCSIIPNETITNELLPDFVEIKHFFFFIFESKVCFLLFVIADIIAQLRLRQELVSVAAEATTKKVFFYSRSKAVPSNLNDTPVSTDVVPNQFPKALIEILSSFFHSNPLCTAS